jgi:hypothetical protein
MNSLYRKHTTLYLALGLTILACLGVWFSTPFAMRLTAATLLALFLPGWLLLRAVGFTAEDIVERVVLACGASYGLTVLGSLGVLYAAGRLSAPLVSGVLGLTSLVLAVVCIVRPRLSGDSLLPDHMNLLFFAIPVVVAAFFSFTRLGYADYWGDEMNGLLRAVSIIAGRRETLFEHTKGPVEVLLPAVFGLLVGRFEPFTLRFPFALAHTVGVGGYYLLARRLFGRNVGLVAALLLAINGLSLAFGRIVQYQAVVFLMMGLSVLMAYRFYRGEGAKYLWLSSFLLGIGLLGHYDMLLMLPPIGYLLWRRYGWRWRAWRADGTQLIGAGITLLVVVALFYFPFFLHPHLTETSSYLSRRVGVSNWPANNFDELYMFAVMYNSRYYVIFITLLGVGTIALDLIKLFRDKHRARGLGLVIATALVLALLAIMTAQTSFVPLLVCVLVLVLLLGFSPATVEVKAVYVWVGVSFIGYVFFVDHPRSHLQVIYLGWSLLAALAAKGLVSALQAGAALLRRRWTLVGVVAVSCLLFGLFANYEYLLFADAGREYILTYPEHKNLLYWEDPNFPFGSRRLYGAPHRLGWQMINNLYLQGRLQGDWDSNDRGSNLFWYTLGSPRNPCYPRYYFLTEFQQNEEAGQELPNFSLSDYVQIGQVWNHDRLQIEVYEFAPMGRDDRMVIWPEPARYTSFVLPTDFSSLPYEEISSPAISNPLIDPPTFRPGSSALQHIANQYNDPRIVGVRDKVALIGYDLDDMWARPGGVVVLTLYWQAVDVVNLPYKTFVHLVSDGGEGSEPKLWAQSDDYPACGTDSTQHWQVGQAVVDRHVIRLPADMPPGGYLLQVGLYEPQTGLRMDFLDALGNPQGTSFVLTGVTVRPAN